MKRLLIIILAIFALAAPVPVMATQTMCAEAMPKMVSMNDIDAHDMSDNSCCDEDHKSCDQACDAMCVATLDTASATLAIRTLDPASLPVATLTGFMTADLGAGLDRPPRLNV